MLIIVHYIWGAGFVGCRTLAVLDELNIDVEGFIDSNITTQNKIIEAIPVTSPDMILRKIKTKPFIIIGTSLLYQDEIEKQLNSFGLFLELDYCSLYNLVRRS